MCPTRFHLLKPTDAASPWQRLPAWRLLALVSRSGCLWQTRAGLVRAARDSALLAPARQWVGTATVFGALYWQAFARKSSHGHAKAEKPAEESKNDKELLSVDAAADDGKV